MEMKSIAVSGIVLSETNPKGRTSGPEFKELVASIKEKGVLMPILVRAKGKGYEVVAGNRRVAAAQEAGLKEIPAHIVEMDDVEAREAQIVENLQRQDVHPLDEGEAYRQLIEKSSPRYEISAVAAKVGKSERYVRDRLALTNLCAPLAKAFREGRMNAGHATVLARATVKQQKQVFADEWRWEDQIPTVAEVKEKVREMTFEKLMKEPPWKNAKAMGEAIVEADKSEGTVINLFEEEVDETYGDPVAFATKLAAYIQEQVAKAEEAGTPLLKITTMYGKSQTKDVLSRDQYKILEGKEVKKSKTAQKAIIVEGSNIGTIVDVTTEKEEVKDSTNYKKTPEEKAKAKKEREDEKKKEEKQQADLLKALENVKWPMTESVLDLMVEMCFERLGYSYLQPIAKRHGLEVVKETNQHGYTSRDFEKPIREHLKDKSKAVKLQFVVEMLLECGGTWHDEKIKMLKKI